MIKMCCSEFVGWFEKGYIKHSPHQPANPPTQTECCNMTILSGESGEHFRVVLENYTFYVKDGNEEFKLLHLDTFLEYCPWCGTKIMEKK